MIDAKQLAEMLIDGIAKITDGGLNKDGSGFGCFKFCAPPKPQTVGEKIAESFQFTFVIRDDAKVTIAGEIDRAIAAAIDKAVADEREACAQIAEGYCNSSSSTAAYVSAAIRARKP